MKNDTNRGCHFPWYFYLQPWFFGFTQLFGLTRAWNCLVHTQKNPTKKSSAGFWWLVATRILHWGSISIHPPMNNTITKHAGNHELFKLIYHMACTPHNLMIKSWLETSDVARLDIGPQPHSNTLQTCCKPCCLIPQLGGCPQNPWACFGKVD